MPTARVLLVAACAAWAAGCGWLDNGRARDEACVRSLECADTLVCTCGICQDPSAPATCSTASNQAVPCPLLRPTCFRACGNYSTAAEPTCQDGQWLCSDGVQATQCPLDQCWGDPEPGQVCSAGFWVCPYGQLEGRGCLTPDGCGTPDGGPQPPPACLFDPACQGSADGCATAWCQGARSPAVCVAGRWDCAQGVQESVCAASCLGSPAPACLAACGDPRVVGAPVCRNAQQVCELGVLRVSCPPDTCWGTPPVGSVGCDQGTWVCGDAGVGPTGGCLTPSACGDPALAPPCYNTVCCTDAPTQPQCEGAAWQCSPSQSTPLQCASRPFCPAPDAGVPDAGPADATPRDAASEADAGHTDAAQPDAVLP